VEMASRVLLGSLVTVCSQKRPHFGRAHRQGMAQVPMVFIVPPVFWELCLIRSERVEGFLKDSG
jgi:hypothetical protein